VPANDGPLKGHYPRTVFLLSSQLVHPELTFLPFTLHLENGPLKGQ
jgi:hypothetical protein